MPQAWQSVNKMTHNGSRSRGLLICFLPTASITICSRPDLLRSTVASLTGSRGQWRWCGPFYLHGGSFEEWMNCSHPSTIECRIKLTPLSTWHGRSNSKSHWIKQRCYHNWISREHLSEQGNSWSI